MKPKHALRRNKSFQGILSLSAWRKLSVGSWGQPSDPSLHGVVEVNAEHALKFIEKKRTETGEKITITHFVGKVFGEILKDQPDLNSELKWGRFHRRGSIDISFQVAIEGQGAPDLSAGTIRSIDRTPLHEVARLLTASAKTIRQKDDPDYRRLKKISPKLPGFLLRPAIHVLSFILNHLNLWSPVLGLPQNSFGSMMITNVGSLGLDFAFPALFPPANVPMIFAIGAIYPAPIYQTNELGVVTETRMAPHLRLCGTVDHRYVDGLHASRAMHLIRKIFAHPESYFS